MFSSVIIVYDKHINAKLHQPNTLYHPDAVDTTIKNKETSNRSKYLSVGIYHVIPLSTNGTFWMLMTEK